MKFPSLYWSRPAGCCCLLCALNIYSFIAVYYTLFYTFCKRQTRQRIFYFWLCFRQVAEWLYIYAGDACKNIQACMYAQRHYGYYSMVFPGKQHQIARLATRVVPAEKSPRLPLRGCARRRVSERNRRRRLLARRLKVARRPDEGRVRSTVPQRRSRARPPLISPLRGQLLPGEKPFEQTLSPSPVPPKICSSESYPPAPPLSLPPNRTTSHSRSPTSAR